tara:strand:- start:5115 stop:5462 length:348 start_codon:yes stop_codon:yes gene_type:complete
MAALPLTEKITQSSTRNTQYRSIVINFGGGYTQRAADGNNSTRNSWSLVYTPLNATERDTLRAFFDSVGSYDTFTWTAPNDTERFYRVNGQLTEESLAGNQFTVRVAIVEEFDLV